MKIKFKIDENQVHIWWKSSSKLINTGLNVNKSKTITYRPQLLTECDKASATGNWDGIINNIYFYPFNRHKPSALLSFYLFFFIFLIQVNRVGRRSWCRGSTYHVRVSDPYPDPRSLNSTDHKSRILEIWKRFGSRIFLEVQKGSGTSWR